MWNIDPKGRGSRLRPWHKIDSIGMILFPLYAPTRSFYALYMCIVCYVTIMYNLHVQLLSKQQIQNSRHKRD